MRGRSTGRVALIAAGAAILLLAWWLRNPFIPYGGETTHASGISVDSASLNDGAARRIEAIRAASAAVTATEARLAGIASAALAAPKDPDAAFEYLKRITSAPETGVLLEEGRVPLAWAGQIRTLSPDTASGTAVLFSPFYTTLEVVRLQAQRRAIATALIHAEPPADRVAAALDEDLNARRLVDSFRFTALADTAGGEVIAGAQGQPLLRIDADPRAAESVRFDQAVSVRARGVVLFGAGLLLLITLGWSDRRSLGSRLGAIAMALAAIALIPWNNFSNYARIFDPAYFYTSGGGPFTANAAVFTMASVLALLAVIALIRSRPSGITTYFAAVGALGMIAGGLVLVQAVAQAIVVPPSGASLSLWLAWEIPLFFLLFACWLAGLWLVRISLRRSPMVNLRSAAFVAVVGGTVATFIVWTEVTEQRLQLAMRDVAGLQRPDTEAAQLLSRLGQQLAAYGTPGTRADLLKRYAVSDLAAAEVQVSLGMWTASGTQVSRLDLAQLPYDSAALTAAVREAISNGVPVIRQTLGPVGRQIFLAVPHRDGQASSVVASPRTRLVAQDPYAPLLGFEQLGRTDPPYTLTLADVASTGAVREGAMTWRRIEDGWHGDENLATSRGVARAHVVVDLRSWPTRIVRASLIVMLDIAIATILWALSAIAEGGFLRWLRGKASRWLRSYRGRLTFALFGFFVLPAVAFAAWSYQRLRGDDRNVRQLLVSEILQSAGNHGLSPEVHTPGETPHFIYSNAFLTESSDSLYEMIAPAGRMLPRPVQLGLAEGGEVVSSWQHNMGGSRIFWGFRGGSTPGGERYVIAAPARSDELIVDQRRRDLTMLLLFATALGGIAAFWLSGIAARILARDLELSRIEVARAERVLAWGEMARQVAHEIKNPLTPIRLGVQHLRRARTDPRIDFDRVMEDNVTRILSEIDRLDEIARAFSRYGSPPGELPAAEQVDAAAILRDVVGLERMGIGGVSWNLLGAEQPVPAYARADELHDVLLNVFENARLARAKEVTIRLSRAAGSVMIAINDDGAGISRTALPRVFEPHFSTRTTGSGLGLAISRRLLESWGGTIDLTSDEGRGARVLITLQTTPA